MAAGDGPALVTPNQQGCVDPNGYLLVRAGVNSGTDGPLTATWNLRIVAGTSGYLMLAFK